MFDFNIYVTVAALAGLLVFLRLAIAWKVLVAFIVMSQGFDVLPPIVYGILIWDIGAIMLFIAAAQLMFSRPKEPGIRGVPVTVLWVFIGWLVICLVYSLVIYSYPAMNTLKSSRQMILGYLSIFVFLRMFRVDKNALSTLIKWFYIITYALLVAAIIQFFVGTQILQGLVIEYKGAVRYLPVFLPISLFYLWALLSKYFQGGRMKIHELVYGALVLVVVAITYTRGIYFAVLASFFVMLFLLQLRGQLRVTSVAIFMALVLVSGAVVIAGGWADRVRERATSAVDIVLSDRSSSSRTDVDTFSGRRLLVMERTALVSEHNPIVGYGFLHESDVPQSLRNRFRYGSVIYSPVMKEKYRFGYPYVLALYSADIGWANVAINTGFVGSALFLLFVVTFLLSYSRSHKINLALSHYRTAFFVQTITLLLLMFNGNTFTSNVQIPALMIAGYLYCSVSRRIDVTRPAGSDLLNRSSS